MPITKKLPERGDLRVRFKVEWPKELSEGQKEKLRDGFRWEGKKGE